MRLRLDERWVNHLCGLPEHGMGCQVVDVVLRSGERVREVVVLHAEELQWPSDRGKIELKDIIEIRSADG